MPAGAFPKPPVRIPFHLDGGHVVIAANVNGSAVRLVVDTGANVSSFSATLKLPDASQTVVVDGFGGRRSLVQVGSADVSLVTMDGRRVRTALGKTVYAKGGWRALGVGGELGLDWLQQFARVTFDFRNHVLILGGKP